MGRNVEIKARARNFERQCRMALELAQVPPEHLIQEDTFFTCSWRAPKAERDQRLFR